jgi:hypothetical protein
MGNSTQDNKNTNASPQQGNDQQRGGQGDQNRQAGKDQQGGSKADQAANDDSSRKQSPGRDNENQGR